MHVFARGGGNFELFWCKKESVVQRGVNFALLVNNSMHVFARRGGKFDWFWWKYERVVQSGVACLFC